MSDVGSRKSDVGSRMSEVGSRKPDGMIDQVTKKLSPTQSTNPIQPNQLLYYPKLLLLQIKLTQVFADDVFIDMAVDIVPVYKPFPLLIYHLKVYLFALGWYLRVEFFIYF